MPGPRWRRAIGVACRFAGSDGRQQNDAHRHRHEAERELEDAIGVIQPGDSARLRRGDLRRDRSTICEVDAAASDGPASLNSRVRSGDQPRRSRGQPGCALASAATTRSRWASPPIVTARGQQLGGLWRLDAACQHQQQHRNHHQIERKRGPPPPREAAIRVEKAATSEASVVSARNGSASRV